jgi:hypothetical protein
MAEGGEMIRYTVIGGVHLDPYGPTPKIVTRQFVLKLPCGHIDDVAFHGLDNTTRPIYEEDFQIMAELVEEGKIANVQKCCRCQETSTNGT